MLIRNVAISKIPNNNDSIYNQFPTIPQKFNNYTFEDLVPDFVQRVCTQWYNYETKNASDYAFVGTRNGKDTDSGLLSKIHNTYAYLCHYNLSMEKPFVL
jgi:hypothetical protein